MNTINFKSHILVPALVAAGVYFAFHVMTPDSLSNGAYACLITPINDEPISVQTLSTLARCTKAGQEFVVEPLAVSDTTYGSATFLPGIYFASETHLSRKTWQMTLHLKGSDGLSGPSLMADILK